MGDQRPVRHGLEADDLDDLATRLGVVDLDRDLLADALVHRSWAHEHDITPNERLEFLGDAVLGVVAADELFHLCPDEPEGRLAPLRAAAVSQVSLASIARRVGVGPFLRLGVGEAGQGGADKDSLLADVVEALLGAIHLDLGFTAAYDVAQHLLAEPLADLLARATALDPKSALKEHAEATLGAPPDYATTRQGPDHAPTFHAEVIVDGRVVGAGSGATKKDAEQDAATVALTRLAPELLAGPTAAPPVGLAGTRGLGATSS